MTIQEKIIRSYSGPSLSHILSIVPDLQKLKKAEQDKKQNYLATLKSLEKILDHLLRKNVPFEVANKFIFPSESGIRGCEGNIRNN